MRFEQVTLAQILLKGSALWRARLALYSQGKLSWHAALAFKGPEFIPDDEVEIEACVGASTINVRCIDTNDTVEYIYPLASVGRIKLIYA